MEKITLPLKESLLAAMKVGETSIEAADYLAKKFENILKKAKMLDTCKDILDKVKEYAEFVRFKLTSSAQPWSGEQGQVSDFQNMQVNLANSAAEKLSGNTSSNLNLDIAISDSAQLLRGYSADGNAVDPKVVKELDVLNNAWLAKNGMVSKGSSIYEANEGIVKTDVQGNQVKVNEEHVRKLIMDPERGLAKFYADKGIPMTIQLHQYPEEGMQEEKRQAVEQAIEVRSTVQAGTEAGVEVEPEAPSSGMSSGG